MIVEYSAPRASGAPIGTGTPAWFAMLTVTNRPAAGEPGVSTNAYVRTAPAPTGPDLVMVTYAQGNARRYATATDAAVAAEALCDQLNANALVAVAPATSLPVDPDLATAAELSLSDTCDVCGSFCDGCDDDDDDETDDGLATRVVCPECGHDEFVEYAHRATTQPVRIHVDGEEDYDDFDYGDDVMVRTIDCEACGHEWRSTGHLLIAAKEAGQRVTDDAVAQWGACVLNDDIKQANKRAADAWLSVMAAGAWDTRDEPTADVIRYLRGLIAAAD